MARGRHPSQKRQAEPPEWNFFTFPVLVGVVGGTFFTSIAIAFAAGGFYTQMQQILWYISLLGMSFCLAHVFTRQLSRFRGERKREREDEAERERRALAARARAAEREQVTGTAAEAPARRRRRRRAS